jgi:hypothetical protein
MVFSVPSDIYARIPKNEKKHFTDMGHPVAWFKNIMKQMEEDFTPSKPSGSKPKDDEVDWDPDAMKTH